MTTLTWETEVASGAAVPREEAPFGPERADPWAAPTAVTYAGPASRPRRKAARRSRQAAPATAVAGPAPASSRQAAARSRAPRRPLRRTIRVLLALPAAVGLALLLAVSLPTLFGCRSLVVMSGSMEPAISTGSVVVVERIPAAEIAVGDIVSFHSPETGKILTHRVQGLAAGEEAIEVETRGDANTGTESWAIEPTGTVGRLVFEIPYLGYLLAPLQGTTARLLLVVGPALSLGGVLLTSIWRDPGGRGQALAGRRRRDRPALRPASPEGI